MPDGGQDRRVRRTKRLLKEALLELIEERDYDRITIRDITQRADVGRSTFYSHYASKEDLLFSGFDRWLLSLPESLPGEKGAGDRTARDVFRFSLPLLEHIRLQKRFFQATIARGSSDRLRQKTTALLAERVRLELEQISTSDEEASPGTGADTLRQAQAHAVAGAFLGLISWWLNSDSRLSAEAVDQVFQRAVRSETDPGSRGEPGRRGSRMPRRTPGPGTRRSG